MNLHITDPMLPSAIPLDYSTPIVACHKNIPMHNPTVIRMDKQPSKKKKPSMMISTTQGRNQ